MWETPGAERLSGAEAMRMLGAGRLGRVAATLDAMPVIWPVPYATVDGEVVFRIPPGGPRRSVDGSVVAFQADGWADPWRPAGTTAGPESGGWHVLAVGPAWVVTSARDIRRFDEAHVPTWPGTGAGHYVRLEPSVVEGHRLRRC